MNKVILLGRLTKEPELRTTPSGTNVCSFSIAVNRRFAKEGQQNADFINCVAWRNTAEFICRYFPKGSMIGVVGSMQISKYEKDGHTYYNTDVIVDEVHFAGSKAKENSSEQASFPGTQIPDDDDLPY